MKLRYGDGNDCIWIATQAISGTTPIVSNVIDMRDFDSVGLQLITTSTVAGTWLIEMSNDFVATMNGNAYGQVSNGAATGTWTDCTALFLKAAAGTAIANPAGTATSQYAQPRDFIRCRALRVTFTPSGGAGNVSLFGSAGSWS